MEVMHGPAPSSQVAPVEGTHTITKDLNNAPVDLDASGAAIHPR